MEDLDDDPTQVYFLRRYTPDDSAPVVMVIGPCIWAQAWWTAHDLVPGLVSGTSNRSLNSGR